MLWNTLIGVDAIDDLLLRWNLRYSERSIFLKDYPPRETRLVDEVLRGLGDLQAVAIRRAIPIVVVLIPTKVQVFKRHAFDERYDLTKPNRVLREFCAARDVPVLDLLEAMAGFPSRSRGRSTTSRPALERQRPAPRRRDPRRLPGRAPARLRPRDAGIRAGGQNWRK